MELKTWGWGNSTEPITGVDIRSAYGFAFAATATTHELTEHLSQHHGIPHSITSDQRTHFTAYSRGIHWFYHVPHRPKVADQIEI